MYGEGYLHPELGLWPVILIPVFYFCLPCNSSPAVGGNNKQNASTISTTAYSDCPTPTVSTIIVSYPHTFSCTNKNKMNEYNKNTNGI